MRQQLMSRAEVRATRRMTATTLQQVSDESRGAVSVSGLCRYELGERTLSREQVSVVSAILRRRLHSRSREIAKLIAAQNAAVAVGAIETRT